MKHVPHVPSLPLADWVTVEAPPDTAAKARPSAPPAPIPDQPVGEPFEHDGHTWTPQMIDCELHIRRDDYREDDWRDPFDPEAWESARSRALAWNAQRLRDRALAAMLTPPPTPVVNLPPPGRVLDSGEDDLPCRCCRGRRWVEVAIPDDRSRIDCLDCGAFRRWGE